MVLAEQIQRLGPVAQSSEASRFNNDWVRETAIFVLRNLPERRSLKEWVQAGGKPRNLNIGGQKWSLEAFTDTMGDAPTHVITMTTTNRRGELLIEGICMDEGMSNITGVYRRVGQHQIGLAIEPVNLLRITQELREDDRLTIIRSFRQTGSVFRTSVLQGLRPEFVRASLRYRKR